MHLSATIDDSADDFETERQPIQNPHIEPTSSESNPENWNETVVEQIKHYHVTGKYPAEWTSEKKRNFRRRAQQFTVKDGNLYYKNRKDGSHRLAIASNTEKNQIFMVSK